MTTQSHSLTQTLFKLNLVRLDAEKERDIYKMKFFNLFQDLKKYKENERALKEENEKNNTCIETLNQRVWKLYEENNNLRREIEEKMKLEVDRVKRKDNQKLNEKIVILLEENNSLKQNLKEIEDKMKRKYEQEKIKNLDQIRKLTIQKELMVKEIDDLKKEISNSPGETKEILLPLETSNLFDACEKGNLLATKYWLQNGSNINMKDGFLGYTPLHYAVHNCNLVLMEYFISKGANLEAQSIYNTRPLHLAAIKGHFVACKILVENKAEKNAQDIDGRTPLTLAVRKNDSLIGNYLITMGANIEIQDNSGLRALHEAVKDRNLPLIKLLIEKGADKNAQISNGKTPLHLAFDYKYPEIIEFLIQNGVDRSIQDNHGRIPKYNN